MTPLKDLRESAGYQLWVATNRWQRFLRRSLAPMGLTHVQYIVLIIVWRLRGTVPHVTQSAVSRLGELDANMASQVVRSLIDKGFLTRCPHPEDGRAVSLVLTPEGESLVIQAREAMIPLVQEFFEPIAAEQASLAAILRQLNENSPITL